MTILTVSDQKRFWSKVDKTNFCWVWTAGKRNGYGHFKLNGKGYSAHRLSYFLANEVDPGSLHVCHTCDNPPCVNPDHLFLGTHSDNMKDAFNKGRLTPPIEMGRRFEKGHSGTKLSDKDIVAIRNEYAKLKTPYRQIAKRYGVDHSRIYQIIKNKGRPRLI